jgi:4-carboxymuconolactone decarboxylase
MSNTHTAVADRARGATGGNGTRRYAKGLLLALSVAATAGAQSPAAPGIHPESLSRVPPVQRDGLDAEGKRIWDYIAGTAANKTMPLTGPAPVSMYSPKLAEPMHAINQYLRTSVVGPRYFELSALMAAREFDQQYEWSSHEPAALRAGVEQRVIDVIKFNRDLAGLSDKDATAIRFGRALLRDREVSPELWAQTVEHFGRQGAIEIAAIIGDYIMAGLMLTAVDQQLPADRKPLLPELRR